MGCIHLTLENSGQRLHGEMFVNYQCSLDKLEKQEERKKSAELKE